MADDKPISAYKSSSLTPSLHIATLLPDASYIEVKRVLSDCALARATSWDDLDRLTSSPEISAILMDPVIGPNDAPRAASIVEKYRSTPTIVYVTISRESFSAVTQLGRIGIHSVFTHPLTDQGRSLRIALESVASVRVTDQFLRTLERWAGQLPPPAERAIIDLFERPHLYASVRDLACRVNASPRHFYRRFGPIPGGAPRKLLIAAKILRAYACMRLKLSVRNVCREVGYESRRALAAHTMEIFGCSPIGLRSLGDPDEVLRLLFEWFHKPDFSLRSPTFEANRRDAQGPTSPVRSRARSFV